jgi:hypothetical protein
MQRVGRAVATAWHMVLLLLSLRWLEFIVTALLNTAVVVTALLNTAVACKHRLLQLGDHLMACLRAQRHRQAPPHNNQPTPQQGPDQANTQSSSITFSDLPLHLQTEIFAISGAPLTTCRGSAAVATDASLTAQWLLSLCSKPLPSNWTQHAERMHWPLLRGALYQLWDACRCLLDLHRYTPSQLESDKVLHHGVHAGRVDLVQMMVQQHGGWGESTQSCRPSLPGALQTAASKGHLGLCTFLLQQPGLSSQDVRTAVCSAAASRHLQVLDLLVSRRPDAGRPGLRGCPLSSAVLGGRTECLELLLQHGASIHADSLWYDPTEDFWQPLATAAELQRSQALRLLLSQSPPAWQLDQALQRAASMGCVLEMQLLLESGASINADNSGALLSAVLSPGSPLARTVSLENLRAVQLLLEAGADITPQVWKYALKGRGAFKCTVMQHKLLRMQPGRGRPMQLLLQGLALMCRGGARVCVWWHVLTVTYMSCLAISAIIKFGPELWEWLQQWLEQREGAEHSP